MKTIVVTVPRDGIAEGLRTTKVDACGFTGEGCKTATEAIVAALGTVLEDSPKTEMYETEQNVERLHES